MEEYIVVDKNNIEQEHICCAISKNDDLQVSSKKTWLYDRFDEGLVFIKSKQRGKCFIEYMPAENAWVPINANNYMYINCLWVSGSLKGNGHSSNLLNKCIKDSKQKGKDGLCILSSLKKKSFLADAKYLSYKGFTCVDETSNGIQLWYYPFNEDAIKPTLKSCCKDVKITRAGYVLYYTNQCPFTAKYVPMLKKLADEYQQPFEVVHITTKLEAQSLASPTTTFVLFKDGKFITHEILSEKKLLKIFEDNR